jgi:gluconate 2-dehydrogenase subunit 3-like protein
MDELELTRRAFLTTVAASAAVAALPPSCQPRRTFFTAPELATLTALCDRIIPPDADPGAAALGASAYIERLLTIFDVDPPEVFAGGPYSGRQPFPDPRTGQPSRVFPRNGFALGIAPSPVQELFWRAEILGSVAAGLPPHLDAQRGGPRRGLRDLYREGIAAVDAAAVAAGGRHFVELSASEQDELLLRLDGPSGLPADPVRGQTFLDLVIAHTLEGCFAAPEYGGNRYGRGWRMVGIEGDSQPLGYSLFSLRDDAYHERPAHPMSTPNPEEIAADGSLAPKPLTPDGDLLQQQISRFAGFLEMLVPGGCA